MSQSERKNPPLSILIAVFFGTLIFSGIIIFFVLQQIIQPPVTDYTGQNGAVREVNPPRVVRDFTLPAHTGTDLALSSLRDSYVLLYFGYTHCPDVCLLTLADLTRVYQQLGTASSRFSYVFVSVDGQRDTPQALASYFTQRDVQHFMIGLSGNDQTLADISSDYGLQYRLNTDQIDASGSYSVDHTASIFLLDRQGRLIAVFAYGTPPETISDYLLNRIQS
jgi:protein SCO1/2